METGPNTGHGQRDAGQEDHVDVLAVHSRQKERGAEITKSYEKLNHKIVILIVDMKILTWKRIAIC